MRQGLVRGCGRTQSLLLQVESDLSPIISATTTTEVPRNRWAKAPFSCRSTLCVRPGAKVGHRTFVHVISSAILRIPPLAQAG